MNFIHFPSSNKFKDIYLFKSCFEPGPLALRHASLLLAGIQHTSGKKGAQGMCPVGHTGLSSY